MSQMKRKTTSVSLTIGSSLKETSSNAVRQSSSTLIQPISIDPKRVQGSSAAHSSGIAPVFTKCLQDISTSKGHLVVFECRIRAKSPFQVNWYREHHPIIDSADFRILRKKAYLSAVPEEACTLVITEAYPEDSGVFKCVAENNDGVVTSSAHLFVFPESHDIEILEGLQSGPGLEGDMEKMCLQNETENVIYAGGHKVVNALQRTTQPENLKIHPENLKIHPGYKNDDVETIEGFEAVSDSSAEHEMSSHRDRQLSKRDCTPHPTPTKTVDQTKFQDFPPEAQSTISPNYISHNTIQNRPGVPCASGPDRASISGVPPPSMFNYERPKHFIQAQPTHPAQWSSQGTGTSNFEVKSPSNQTHNFGEQKHSPSSTSVNSPKYFSSTSFVPTMEPTRQTASSAAQFPPSSSQGQKATLMHSQSPAAYLSSVLPSHTDHMNNYKAPTTVESSYFEPSYKNVPKQPPPTSDHQIQGTKNALIQDLERKLRCKDNLLQNGNQRLTYEEKMARRLLGRENAASVFEIDADGVQDSEQCPDNQATPGQTTQDWNRPSRGEGNEHRSIQEKLFPPRFLTIPGDLELEEGRFCRIDFKVTGLPAPDVAWFLNERPVRADQFHKIILSEKSFHSLIFEVVRLADAGEYECVATNRAGKATFRMQLDVLAHEHTRTPSFIRKPQSARGMEGDTVKLECQVAAVPFPQILLKKNNEMLQYNTDRIRLLQDSNGKICLLIYNVSKKDDGWYTISAVNEAGVATCHARVDVGTRFNPNTPAPKPLKVRPTFSLYSTLNERVQEAKHGEPFQNAEPPYPGLFESDEL